MRTDEAAPPLPESMELLESNESLLLLLLLLLLLESTERLLLLGLCESNERLRVAGLGLLSVPSDLIRLPKLRTAASNAALPPSAAAVATL